MKILSGRKYEYLELLPEEEVKSRLKIFEDLNIQGCNSLDIFVLLKLHKVTIKNRIMILEEAGFDKEMITISVLSKYFYLMRSSIKTLKEKKYMSQDNNVIHSMLNHLGVENLIHLPNKEHGSLLETKNLVMSTYLQQRLEMENNKLKIAEIHWERMKHKSLRVIKENIDLCINNIGLPVQKVATNPFLIYQNTENTYEILSRVKEIFGVDIKQVLKSKPKILSEPVDNIQNIKDTLKEFNAPEKLDSAMKRVLTLKAETVRQRLIDFDKFEFLSACRYHPRVFDIIFCHTKVAKRLSLLDEIRLNYATVHMLTSGAKTFDRFYNHGYERQTGKDTINFICNELKCGKTELRSKLNRHPFWEHISLVNVQKIIIYLKDKFTANEIYDNIYILLYPLKKIEKELEILESRPELNSYKIDGKVRQDMVLPLIIYYIEKEYNFSFQGVWDYDSESQQLGVDAPLQCKVSL